MKNITLILSSVVALTVASAGQVVAGSGPYGTSGPADYTVTTQTGESYQAATADGTGPYGAFAILKREAGAVSKVAATLGGSGPFGTIASYGMIQGSGSATVGAGKDCIVLAKNCVPDR